MPRINKRLIYGLQATGANQYFRDNNIIGFGIKVTPAGKANFFVEKRMPQGDNVRMQIGNARLTPLEDAKIRAQEILLQISRGEDPRDTTPTVENSLEAVLERHISNRVNMAESTKRDYQKILSNCFGDWKRKDVSQITKEMIAGRYRKLRDEGKSDAYINKALRSLRTFLGSSGLTINPVAQFVNESGVSTASTVRERFLRSHEIQRIVEATQEQDGTPNLFGELLMFYLLTGCRLNEALNLKKTDYSASNGTLVFRETKNRRDHKIPTYGWIKAIVERAIENSETDKIFDYTYRQVRTKHERAREHFGFDENWTIHDLRRTFAEHCELAGVDLGNIATALNHTPTGVTQRHYARGELAKLETLRGVYEKLQRQYRAYLEDVGDVRLSEGWDDPLDPSPGSPDFPQDNIQDD